MASTAVSFPVRSLVVALCGGALLLIAWNTPAPAPVYAVGAVRAGLSRAPGAWVGRTLRVRAVADNPCLTWMGGANPACISWQPALLDASAPNAAKALPLGAAPQLPLLAALRRLPLTRWLVGTPQQLRWGVPATYRVRLETAPATVCGRARCYQAVLLDAALRSYSPH